VKCRNRGRDGEPVTLLLMAIDALNWGMVGLFDHIGDHTPHVRGT
jgi:hypothetical protein